MGRTHGAEMLLIILSIQVDITSIAAVHVMHRVRYLVAPLCHKVAAETVAPMVPQYNVLQPGPSAPMGDRVAQHNTKGSEGELLIRISMALPDEGATIIDHRNVSMIRLRCGCSKETWVGDNGIRVQSAE
jgi:hypothetical protein